MNKWSYMRRELIKRYLNTYIENEAKKIGGIGVLNIYPFKIRDNDNRMIVDVEKAGDILFDIEIETGGKVKLQNPTAYRNPKIVVDEFFKLNEQEPYYYKVLYDPNVVNKQVRKKDQNSFSLSFKKGLYRGNDEIYHLSPKDKRFHILNDLRKSFQTTKVLAQKIDISEDNYKAQISGIRKMVKDTFPDIDGNEFIVGKQRLGYRLGDGFSIHVIRSTKE